MAGVCNIGIDQGSDWALALLWKDATDTPVNVVGFTARMMIRRRLQDDNALVELTTENGRIDVGLVLDGNGDPSYNILLQLDDLVTAALPAAKGDHVWPYDLELVSSGGEVTRLLEGLADVSPEITR